MTRPPLESEAMLDSFFNESEFALPVTWQTPGQEPVTLSGIFDQEHLRVFQEQGPPVALSMPRVQLPEYKVPGIKKGDTLTINGVKWYVSEPMPDGTGVVEVRLVK